MNKTQKQARLQECLIALDFTEVQIRKNEGNIKEVEKLKARVVAIEEEIKKYV